MLAYNIISIACICILAGTFLYVLAKIILLKRTEKILFIRDFKKGKVAIVYIVALALYFVANLHAEQTLVQAFSDAFENAVDLLAFKISADNAFALAESNALYNFTLYLCYSLVYVNGVMFVISLCNESIWTVWNQLTFRLSKKSKCVIVGNNEDSEIIYRTCTEKRVLLADKLNKEARTELYLRNFKYSTFVRNGQLLDWVVKESERMARLHKNKGKRLYEKKERFVLIINTGDDKENLVLCGKVVERIQKNPSLAGFLEVYAYAESKHADVYAEYEKKALGCLRQVNKYALGAIEFIDKYPLTEYMDERHINYATSCLKEGVKVNVSFVGFGKRNRKLFLAMVANNQFIRQDEKGETHLQPVFYHLFDKDETEQNTHTNHTYSRFRHNFVEKAVNKDEYLPFPELPAEDLYHHVNFNSIDFYDDIKNTLSSDELAINYIIVSIGDDLTTVDMANKLQAKIKEWGFNNVYLFANVEDKRMSDDVRNLIKDDKFKLFGDKFTSEYNYLHITREKFAEMAKKRNFVYDIEYELAHGENTELTEKYLYDQREKSARAWYEKRTGTERESNVYACLSLRQKLHLMGLDYEKDTGRGLTNEQYLEKYAKDDKPKVAYQNERLGKDIIEYSLDFAPSRRTAMATQEHYRWNAYMLTKGFVPASKKEILEEVVDGKHTNGKNYLLRRHGNITTMAGLVEFRKMLAKRKGTTEESEDVIKYDYQILDDAYWLLKETGYSIIER